MQRILAASSSASVAWQCLISQIGFKFVNSESLWSVRPCTIYIYFIHMYIRMYVCMYVLSLVLCALQFWQSSLQSSSQKVKKGYHHETPSPARRCSVCPPRWATLLPELLGCQCAPLSTQLAGLSAFFPLHVSAASDVYYIALYKHICIYAPCGGIARLCDGALNTKRKFV